VRTRCLHCAVGDQSTVRFRTVGRLWRSSPCEQPYDRRSQILAEVAEVGPRGLDALKIVLITNGSRLFHPPAWQTLEVLAANNGEIWAKLDAGI
jgi:hypothetical protein